MLEASDVPRRNPSLDELKVFHESSFQEVVLWGNNLDVTLKMRIVWKSWHKKYVSIRRYGTFFRPRVAKSEVGVGAVKALQRLFPESSILGDPCNTKHEDLFCVHHKAEKKILEICWDLPHVQLIAQRLWLRRIFGICWTRWTRQTSRVRKSTWRLMHVLRLKTNEAMLSFESLVSSFIYEPTCDSAASDPYKNSRPSLEGRSHWVIIIAARTESIAKILKIWCQSIDYWDHE